MPEPDRIRVRFQGGPFGFDEKGALRCTKCGGLRLEIDGRPLGGVPWAMKRQLCPLSDRPEKRLPKGWTLEGVLDRAEITSDTWQMLYKELWQHIRHVEGQRLGYATLYGGLSILSFVIVGKVVLLPSILAGFVFLLLGLYTLLQSLLASKLSQAVEHDHQHAELLLRIAAETTLVGTIGAFRPMDGTIVFGRWRALTTRRLVPLLYVILALCWAILAVLYFLGYEPLGSSLIIHTEASQ